MIDRRGDGFANENERREHAQGALALTCWARSQGQPWATDEVVAAKQARVDALKEGV